MTKTDSKKENKKKDLVREVNKKEGIWKALENKTWMVAEFGVYILLLGFTIFAVGYYTPSALERSSLEKKIESDSDSMYYNLEYYCDNIYDCQANVDDDISYTADTEKYVLSVNDVEIVLDEPIGEFAHLANGFIATVITNDNDTYTIDYYNNEGKLVKSYKNMLSSMGKLDKMDGTYATCNGSDLEVYEYEITYAGTFNENLIGTFESEDCSN